ncbi:VOC family protein [Listeria monocytogenes]|uniref:Glyoxalase n=2 Tax=Listeria monocytogenes TaxID=1639 RepID=A0A0B8QRA0_LISMN|nr:MULTISPECIES: VOC family protein [Listeria]EAE1680696.1 VOC family protein [Listeria monocytogenes LIS0071]EAE3706174.1 VOC family protein [Listeria monocytogenes serotype 1/2b]EAF3078090.1 VOC family protein [Listeria monocytogenes serotype 1/2a]EAG6252699.1 VOC family protein [Listeria monocytogenes CFSAN003806]EAG6262072.1 VOC family protein [Listeria monocytogenes CFSAN003725]EAG6332056.1 VOC family protein [Listeria monocytogenes CFSAN002346]EAG6349510.1 VOC family protein [Listeria 
MVEKIGQVMLYVENQAAVRDFWVEKLDFVVVSEEVVNGEIQWIEIAPTKGVETTFVLQNKKKVAEMNPEMNLGTPSILLFGNNVAELYEEYKDKGITVGDLVDLPMGRVFNFSDNEGNYFAICEK